jgi:MoxR-like ATPase
VKEVVHDVLRHRIMLTYEAEAENVTSDMVIDKILGAVPVP